MYRKTTGAFSSECDVLKTDFEKLVRDETPDAVIAITPAGKVVHWNKGAERLFGHASAEAVGQMVEEIIVPADQREENQAAAPEPVACELFLRRNPLNFSGLNPARNLLSYFGEFDGSPCVLL
jgi:PAS domain-containing protein